MDLPAMTGGSQKLSGSKLPHKEQQPAFEYTAQAASPIVNGEVKVTISENSFVAAALFEVAEVSFATVNALEFADYTVTVKTDEGCYIFSRMGEWAERFSDALRDAYNKAVLRSLFVSGSPIVTATGGYGYSENGISGGGNAPVQVYENCVTILPPDLSARRIPLCFVNGLEKGDHTITLKLNTSEAYTLRKLGYDTAPVAEAVEKQIRKLREKSLAAIKELDPTLTAAQASQLAKLMPEGAAVSVGRLAAIAPSFVAALEKKLSGTRAAESYAAFRELSGPAQIYIGFRKNEAGAESGGAASIPGGQSPAAGLTDGGNPIGMLGGLAGGAASAEGDETEPTPPEPYLLWLIAPSPDGQSAAVEFAEADIATFVYKTEGDFDLFAGQINRALEAISFKREVIRMTDEELRKPENADYYMAAKRTGALQFIRANFAGRIIHSSPESWKRKLLEFWNGTQTPPEQPVCESAKPKFCGGCGAALKPGVKFCGDCGIKAD